MGGIKKVVLPWVNVKMNVICPRPLTLTDLTLLWNSRVATGYEIPQMDILLLQMQSETVGFFLMK